MAFADRTAIGPDQRDFRLGIVSDFVDSLDSSNTKYCHWKSNEHLLPAINGDTDLDILFDQKQKRSIEKALRDANYIRFKPCWYLNYPHIADYLSIDSNTGKLVHIHAHFGLVVGKKRLKGHHLPWEKKVLETRVYDDEFRIFRSNPCHEFLLLLVRLALKSRRKTYFNTKKVFIAEKEAAAAGQEFLWLKKRVTQAQLITLGNILLGKRSAKALSDLYTQGLSTARLQKLKSCAAGTLDRHRRYGKLKSLMVTAVRNGAYLVSRINQKLGLFDLPMQRTAIGDGLIIALMGSDGCGKSTQWQIIQKKLSSKIDVLGLYMGSGDGAASLVRKPLILANTLRNRIFGVDKNETMSKTHPAIAKRKKSGVATVWRTIWALSLILEKKAKVGRAAKAKSRGIMVICDRYPQSAIQGYNDGPLLQSSSGSPSGIRQRLAKWEMQRYSQLEKVAPDLVIKLMADSELLRSRRMEMNREQIEKKQEGIRSLIFPKQTKVVEINAALPMEQVTAQIMNAISSLFPNLTKNRVG